MKTIRYIEFQVLPAVALAGLDQIILQAPSPCFKARY